MIEAALLGSFVGIIAGLLPGIHTNLIAVTVATMKIDVWFACVFLVAVAVSRSVIDAVPTVFLGAAESENVMALLPGHKLLKQGQGKDAVKFFVIGSVLGIIIGILLLPIFMIAFPFLFSLMQPWMFWLLAGVILLLFLKERKWMAIFIFFLTGLLGVIALSSVRDPLFPMLSGLFGASGLLLSVFERIDVPVQAESDSVHVSNTPMVVAVVTGVMAGSIVTLFPGLGPSQAAALSQVKHMKPIRYLILVGALGTIDVLISLVTFFVLGKTRNGAVAVIEQLIGSIPKTALWSFVAVTCLAGGLSAIAAIYASRFYAKFILWIDYSGICLAIVFILAVLSVVLSGWLGLLVFITATAAGLLAPLTNTSRSHAMGCLLLPTLLLLW